jgi:hypothetical protein
VPFSLELYLLHFPTAWISGRQPAKAIHQPMPRQFLIAIVSHPAHYTRCERVPSKRCNIAIGRNLTSWDLSNQLLNGFAKRCISGHELQAL